jgi:hypothetical protein
VVGYSNPQSADVGLPTMPNMGRLGGSMEFGKRRPPLTLWRCPSKGLTVKHAIGTVSKKAQN